MIENIKNQFFGNLGLRQTIFKNTFWLAVGEGVSTFLKFFLVVYIAKILGATEYGKFTFALAFIGLFVVFSDLGVSKILTREFSKDKDKEKDFPSILSLKIILSAATLVLVFIGSFFITPDPLIRRIIVILALYTATNNLLATVYSFFRARQHMEYQAGAEVLQALLTTGLGFLALFALPSIENLSFAYLLAVSASLILILLFFHLKVFQLKLSFHIATWKNYLAISWPMALAGIFGSIYINIDSTIMGYLGQINQTGWYNAAHKITGVVVMPMVLISQSFFPVLSKLSVESKEKLQKVWNYYIKVLLFLIVPLVAGGIVLASKIIDFIYDQSFLPSVPAFQILMVASGIGVLTSPLIQILLIFNYQRKIFKAVLFGAIINSVLNLILIPRYSLYGAAISTVVTFLLILILYFIFATRLTQIKMISSELFFPLAAVLFASVLMYFIISQPLIYNLHVIFATLTGAVTYLAGFFAINFLRNLFTVK